MTPINPISKTGTQMKRFVCQLPLAYTRSLHTLFFLLSPQPAKCSPDEDVFSTSFLPPIQLPLNYSLHSKHRALPKQVKSKLLQISHTSSPPTLSHSSHIFVAAVTQVSTEGGDTSTVKLVRPVAEPTIPPKHHHTTAAELFTPKEVMKSRPKM